MFSFCFMVTSKKLLKIKFTMYKFCNQFSYLFLCSQKNTRNYEKNREKLLKLEWNPRRMRRDKKKIRSNTGKKSPIFFSLVAAVWFPAIQFYYSFFGHFIKRNYALYETKLQDIIFAFFNTYLFIFFFLPFSYFHIIIVGFFLQFSFLFFLFFEILRQDKDKYQDNNG